MKIHYYVLCSRSEALIASHLTPGEFGTYMAVGTRKLASGHVIFFEIDPGFSRLTDHFKVDDIETRCVPHEDGSPKRSKYISVYRVMEFLPLPVFGPLFLTTPDGRVLELLGTRYGDEEETPGPNLYQELCPLVPLVASGLPPARFVRLMTNPENHVSVPRLFFADMLLDRDAGGKLAGHLPYRDPLHILDCVHEVEQMEPGAAKPSKTVTRTPQMEGFYRAIRRGFFLGDQEDLRFYRFPGRGELEVHHAKWWRSAQAL